VGWGFEFETGLGTTLIEVANRLHHPLNQAWSAVETISPQTPELPAAERILGTIFIDGQAGKEGTAKLRAFIVDDSARGLGLGRKLMNAAMSFVIKSGFSECRLTTMRSLFAARKLYEQMGFTEVAEVKKLIWGVEVMELEYCWTRPDSEKIDDVVM
jgi:ribosomal protein S18 acetylase RimI-like enzyme